jgi:hypothetical protein
MIRYYLITREHKGANMKKEKLWRCPKYRLCEKECSGHDIPHKEMETCKTSGCWFEGGKFICMPIKNNELKESIKKLHDAVNFSNRMFPLPRCIHGHALKDHSGEKLAPSCGCTYNKEISCLPIPNKKKVGKNGKEER